MAGGPANSDAGIASTLFGVELAQGTGAPGTPGISAATTSGPVIGSPVVSTPFASVQLSENRPVVAVTSGDTSANSDDLGAHVDALLPGPLHSYLNTGAGDGHPSMVNPNARG